MAPQNGIAVEIVKFDGSDAFLADNKKAVGPTLDVVGRTSGLLGSFFGPAIQDPKTGFIINVWETLEHHNGLVNNKEEFDQVLTNFKLAYADLKYLVHAHFNVDPFVSINAPVTEFALWTLKENADAAVFEQKVDTLVKLAISWGEAAGSHGGGWGKVVENERQYFVTLGWDNLELFTKSVQASEQALQLIGELKELADLELLHTVLSKY